MADDDDYWNTSDSKAYSFDIDEEKSSTVVQPKRDKKLFVDDNISELSFELPQNSVPLSLIIGDSDLQMILEEQSSEESPLPKGISLEEEVRILRRQVQERYNPPPVSLTINRLLIGKNCSLEAYKTLQNKTDLLDEAIASGNGSAILRIVLFMVRTLKKTYVNQILQVRPEAVNHYLNYMAKRLQINECLDCLTMLGRDIDASILQFKVSVQTSSNSEVRHTKLQKVFNDYYAQASPIPFAGQIITNYISLLKWQLKEKSAGNPNSSSIVDTSALESLYYVCQKHKWADTTVPSPSDSPLKFAEQYRITPAQFEWIALNERATSQAWRDLDGLFEKKAWHNLKSKTFSIHIPLDLVVLKLHSLNAPSATLNAFLGRIDDCQKKLALAYKVNAVRTIIDALASMKDKTELESFRDKLGAGTEEKFYADNALKSLNSKWKTDGINIIKKS